MVHEHEWTNPHTQWTSTPRLCNCMDSIERRRRETSTNYMSPFSGYPWTRGPYVSKPSSPVSRVRSTTGYFNYHPGRDVDPQSLSDPWTGVCKGGGKGPVRWKSLTRREGAILCWEPTNERKKGGIFLRSIRLDGRKVLCLGIIDSRKILYKGLVGTDRVKDLTSGGHRGGGLEEGKGTVWLQDGREMSSVFALGFFEVKTVLQEGRGHKAEPTTTMVTTLPHQLTSPSIVPVPRSTISLRHFSSRMTSTLPLLALSRTRTHRPSPPRLPGPELLRLQVTGMYPVPLPLSVYLPIPTTKILTS